MAKAKRVESIHADCPACGVHLIIDEDTGEITTVGESPKADDPVQPTDDESKKEDAEELEKGENGSGKSDLVEDPEEPENLDGKTELEQSSRGNW